MVNTAGSGLTLQLDAEREGLYRIKLLRMKLMPYTGFHAYPNVSETFTWKGREMSLHTNNLGFFSDHDIHPFSGEKLKTSPSDRLVLVTGGSTAMGWGASVNDKMIAAQIEKILNEEDLLDGGRWYALNLANNAWIAYQEFIALSMYGLPLVPDFVVVFDGRNDLFVPTAHGERVPNYFYFEGQNRLNEILSYGFAKSWRQRLFPFLRCAELREQIGRVTQRPPPHLSTAEMLKAVRFYLHSLDGIRRLFADVPMIFATQPTCYLFDDYEPWKEKYGGIRIDELRSLVQEYYGLIRSRLPELLEGDSRCQYWDASMIFSGDQRDRYFLDDCHLGDEAQRIVAEGFAQRIIAARKATAGS
jgi:hypothetical protein